jgi:hypothetical protein
MPANAGIHVFLRARPSKTWMAGTEASEATPFFERLTPGHDDT